VSRRSFQFTLRVLCLSLAGFCLVAAGLSESASATETNYGSWDPSGSTANIYTDTDAVFNDSGVSEQTSFVCITPSGQTISAAEGQILGRIFLAGTDVYNGDFSFADSAAGERADQPPENGGYPNGESGLNRFLDKERELLRAGNWIDYDSRTLEKRTSASNSYQVRPGWSVVLQTDSSGVGRTQGNEIAELIPNDIGNPLELTSELPPACALSPLDPDSPDFGNLFSNSGDYFTDMLLYTPARLAAGLFNVLQPHAFKYAFFTPHSERGDLFWDLPATCSPSGNGGLSSAEAGACSGGEALGFSEKSLSAGSADAWFLRVAASLQWLISGFYFMILFAAAIVFMFRGNRSSNLRLLDLLPRLILATVLTMSAGYLIGMLVSFSNVAVQTIFEFNDINSIAAINTFLLQSGNIVGGPEIIQNLTQIVVGILTSLFFLAIILVTLLRQMLFVGLLVLAPLAAFSLLVERWRGNAILYMRVLLTVIFLPVVFAFILAIGMGINPLVRDPLAAYGDIQGIIGIGLMLLSFFLIYRSVIVAKEFVLRGGGGVRDAIGADRFRRSALRDRLDRGPANKLIPAGREAGAALPASAGAAGVGGSGAGRQLEAGRPSTSGLSGSTLSSAGVSAAIGQFQGARRIAGTGAGSADSPGRKISAGQARAYQSGLKSALRAHKIGKKGAGLSSEERDEIRSRYAEKHGGKLSKQGDSWYLMPSDV